MRCEDCEELKERGIYSRCSECEKAKDILDNERND